MYGADIKFKTIKEAQIDVLRLILSEGEEIEETLEVNNISICVDNPELCDEDLSDLVTPIAAKHMSQMMLEPNPKLEKTHYTRLYNWETIPFYEIDQIEEVIKRLKENPSSKRCILTLWQPQDIEDKYALSWTFAQLLIRDNKLIITNYFRSCDIYNAFPFNCLGIAKLQVEIAKRLGIETGEFIIHIGSAHIYNVHKDKMEQYLAKLLNTIVSI